MISASLAPLAGSLLSVLMLSGNVYSKSSSFAVEIHGAGVKFLDQPLSPDNVGVFTSDNNLYRTNITLGGLNMTVILDTGSFDLWVNGGRQLELTNTTTLQTGETFGKGNVTGNIEFAELKLGDFVIDSQAFLSATETHDLEGTGDGILGISFNTDSNVQLTIAQAWGQDAADALGNTPLPALFAQEPDLPNNFDVQLARSNGLDSIALGTFIISSHDDAFQNITDAPLLPSVSNEHWSVVMDAMNINGKPFTFNQSRIDGLPQGTLAAVLDTGFSFPPLPPPAVDAIYSSIPGAVFDANLTTWLVPCNASTKLSFVFAGQEFFVHPLDLTSVVATPLPTEDGGMQNVTVCINTYQYLTLDPTQFTGFDLILGDAFLRNVYASFNYGDDQSNGTPYVQMLTTTPDFDAAMDEFNKQRPATLAQLPPTIDPSILVKSGGVVPAGSETGGGQSTQSQGQATQTQGADGDPKPTKGSDNGALRNLAQGRSAASAAVLLLATLALLL